MEMKDRVRARRKKLNLSQAKLGALVGMSQVGIRKIEEGGGTAMVLELARALACRPEWLKSGEGPEELAEAAGTLAPSSSRAEALWEGPERRSNPTSGRRKDDVMPISPLDTVQMRRIPVISYIQAGDWREVVDCYTTGDGYAAIYTDLDVSRCAFALEIIGLSMFPQFEPGDRVIIDPEIVPQPGDFVAAKNDGHEATFKKYRPRGRNADGKEVFELVPLNDDFPTLRSDVEPIQIIGTMVEHRKYRRR